MLYRLIGKFVFIFFILPFLTRHTKNMALAMGDAFLEDKFEKMSPEQKQRFAKAYPSLVQTRPVNAPSPIRRPGLHEFVQQEGSYSCGHCNMSRTNAIHGM